MKIVKGNKKLETNELQNGFDNVVIDLGTGDGRFVYKQALVNKNNLYVGIDPSASQLEKFSKKSNKKKLGNILFVVGSLEQLPPELKNCANEVFIILPWGTLLQSVIAGELDNVVDLMVAGATLTIVLGYSKDSEPSETKRLNLPEISEKLIRESIIPKLRNIGLINTSHQEISKKQLKQLGTTWGNRLTFGQSRDIFKLEFKL